MTTERANLRRKVVTKEFYGWPSINQFASMYKHMSGRAASGMSDHLVKFRSKIKLHGTNGSVVVMPDGTFYAQSRSRILSTDFDNAGFLSWVNSTNYDWSKLAQPDGPVVVYGEWCGPGIQKGVALTQLERKIFAVFAIVNIPDVMISEPTDIENLMFPVVANEIFILPWESEETEINLFNSEKTYEVVADMEKHLEGISQRDPWVYRVFDVDGPGEGYVWYPMFPSSARTHGELSNYMFKTKTKEHTVTKNTKLIPVSPEITSSVNEFLDMFVTENRLNQIANEVNGEDGFSQKKIGPFIGAMNKDVHKESVDEVEASELTWKQITYILTNRVRQWYMTKIGEL